MAKNINLLEKNKTDMKPLVVIAVELNYYDIVVLIMNKLLELNEIKFNDNINAKDITQLLDGFQQKHIIVKDQSAPNFYSLVMVYLKNGKLGYYFSNFHCQGLYRNHSDHLI